MRMSEVKLGAMYTAKVSGGITTVRVDCISENYDGRARLTVTNLRTGKVLTFRSAMRLRREVKPEDYSGDR